MLVGFATAAIAASLFMNVLMFSTFDLFAGEYGVVSRPDFWVSVAFFTFFVAYLAFIPVCILVIYAEFLARRDWLFLRVGRRRVRALCPSLVLDGPRGPPSDRRSGLRRRRHRCGHGGRHRLLARGRPVGGALAARSPKRKRDGADTPSP